MVNINFKTTQEIIVEIQGLKGKTKIVFYQIVSKNCYGMTIRRQSGYIHFEQDTFAKNAQIIGKIFHEL